MNNISNDNAEKSAQLIQRKTNDIKIDIAIILGSGLGGLTNILENAIKIDYSDLVGFPKPSVHGHSASLHIGQVKSYNVAMLSGRSHFYEGGNIYSMWTPISTISKLGCKALIVTNAAGSLDLNCKPGNAMMITDHISMFVSQSPLFSVKGNERFVSMQDAYDPNFIKKFREYAKEFNFKLSEGVYVWACGPQFETPAEIKMLTSIGAHAVGMSTIPDVTIARYLNLRVVGFSNITNMGCGLSNEVLSHEQTIAKANEGAGKIKSLINKFLNDSSSLE